jgi:hypothetical protein
MPTGLEVLDAPGARMSSTQKARVDIDVGDLAAGEERHVLVKLRATPSGSVLAFPAPEVTYTKAATAADGLVAHRADTFRIVSTGDAALVEKSRRDDVRVRILQIEASLALSESMQAYAAGDKAKAKVNLENKKAQLRSEAARTKNEALAAEAANFDKVLDVVEKESAASAQAQDLIKDQKARAFKLRR